MLLELETDSTEEQADEILGRLQKMGYEGRLLRDGSRLLVHIVDQYGGSSRAIRGIPGVAAARRTPRSLRPFYPYHVINWSIISLGLLTVLVLLAGWLPPGLGPNVDLQAPPPGLGPPWYFRGLDQFLLFFPEALAPLAVLAATLFWVVLFALPWLDRSAGHTPRQRPIAVFLGVLTIVVFLFFSFQGLTGGVEP
jgi:quinol-cytochrome oxidoreductase complex cytochrome b subunit